MRDEGPDGQAIFLDMTIRKGDFKTDDEGNFLFNVMASNENLDFEQQRILQQALLDSKDYFLSNGVVSKDHLHKRHENGREITDEEYIIGEPVSVYTEGRSTWVKGKLYKNNPHASKFIDLLRSGSSRVKASVGGIMPMVQRAKDGTEKVVSFLWNDLALTVAPVNYTVSPAYGVAKCLTSLEFVKSLSAGYGTNSAEFTGGRALIPEDVENRHTQVETTIADLLRAMEAGDVKNKDEAREFLENRGFSNDEALYITGELIRVSIHALESATR